MEFLPPVDDIDAIWSLQERQAVGSMLRESHVGSPATVRERLTDLAQRTQADELMLVTETWDLEDRIRSYQLLAALPRLTGVPVAQSRPGRALSSGT